MISVCIPTYEMGGEGAKFLKRSLDILATQTYKDFEVIISDNSENDEIENLCKYYNLAITYVRNPIKGMASNTNEAMRHAKGDIIKILYMDDYLNGNDALEQIAKSFTENVKWLATGCIHLKDGQLVNPHYPSYNKEIYMGNNTIGSPSVVAIRKGCILPFDETMTWLLDCDLYARMYQQYGEPRLLYDLNVVMGLHKNQVTNILAEEVKRAERDYMLKKFI